MSETMQGTRADWPFDGLPPEGSYYKVPEGTWHACTPGGYPANLAAHTVTEHEDGTITVTPSIKVSLPTMRDAAEKELWHGFLERGVWRSC